MWIIGLFVLAFLIPYNTGAIINLYNSSAYDKHERRRWLAKILFLPFYGTYQYNKQRDHETLMQDSVEASANLLSETKSEAVWELLD